VIQAQHVSEKTPLFTITRLAYVLNCSDSAWDNPGSLLIPYLPPSEI